jgi:uncharacterized membrane protein
MEGLPLHPAIVHVPIGVGLVVPVMAGLVALALWRGRAARSAWSLVVLVQAVVLGGALAAMRTGEAEEERTERFASEAAVERHEEQAEVFTWLAGVALAAGVAVLVVPGRTAMVAAAVAATVASAAVAGATFRVGHSGGELVYREGAALAYRDAGRPPPPSAERDRD